MNPKVKNILEWVYCIVIAVVLALLFRYFIGTPTIVKQISMYPTLEQNQRLWLNRWGFPDAAMPRVPGVPPDRQADMPLPLGRGQFGECPHVLGRRGIVQ